MRTLLFSVAAARDAIVRSDGAAETRAQGFVCHTGACCSEIDWTVSCVVVKNCGLDQHLPMFANDEGCEYRGAAADHVSSCDSAECCDLLSHDWHAKQSCAAVSGCEWDGGKCAQAAAADPEVHILPVPEPTEMGPKIVGKDERCNGSLPPQHQVRCADGLFCDYEQGRGPEMMRAGAWGVCKGGSVLETSPDPFGGAEPPMYAEVWSHLPMDSRGSLPEEAAPPAMHYRLVSAGGKLPVEACRNIEEDTFGDPVGTCEEHGFVHSCTSCSRFGMEMFVKEAATCTQESTHCYFRGPGETCTGISLCPF